jgi:hypothetical protein
MNQIQQLQHWVLQGTPSRCSTATRSCLARYFSGIRYHIFDASVQFPIDEQDPAQHISVSFEILLGDHVSFAGD